MNVTANIWDLVIPQPEIDIKAVRVQLRRSLDAPDETLEHGEVGPIPRKAFETLEEMRSLLETSLTTDPRR